MCSDAKALLTRLGLGLSFGLPVELGRASAFAVLVPFSHWLKLPSYYGEHPIVDTCPSRVGRGSGLTGPHRRTFAPAIQASAHSMLTALRHPACAGQQRRLLGPGQPLTDSAFETVNFNVLGVVRAIQEQLKNNPRIPAHGMAAV